MVVLVVPDEYISKSVFLTNTTRSMQWPGENKTIRFGGFADTATTQQYCTRLERTLDESRRRVVPRLFETDSEL